MTRENNPFFWRRLLLPVQSFRILIIIFVLFVLETQIMYGGSEIAENQERSGGMEEGWRKCVPIGEPLPDEGGEYVLWVEHGWLHVKRQTEAGGMDWHIVLARARDAKPPTVVTDEGKASFEVSYLRGRYFIRENGNVLRCVRERKAGEGGTLARTRFPKATSNVGGSAGSNNAPPVLTGWESDGWFYIGCGSSKEFVDCVVRLNHMDLEGGGFGFQGYRGIRSLRRAFHGDFWIFDDGEMMLALRVLESQVKTLRTAEKVRKALIGGPAPEIDAKAWLNADRNFALEQLRGKVVLLDFWGTWCGPCVKSIPKVQELYEKHKAKGLVVVGVHSAQGSEKCEDFVKRNELTFPIALDSGNTAERYAVGIWPSYFVIDKSGKVVQGFLHQIPKMEEVERLLSK